MALKVVPTKLAKQVGDYALLLFDMQFAGRAFGLAAQQKTRSAEQVRAAQPSAAARLRVFQELDPLLRAGAALAQMDQDKRTDTEAVKAALFEAGVITYGRCFNSGQRTHLAAKVFHGELSAA